MNHSFDIDVAQEVGVEAAILFNSIQHWCARNSANKESQRDGHTWMYNSRSAWCELFPYLGEKQIRNAIERLIEADLVVREQFSTGSVNRTYWYRLAERAKAFGPKGQTVGRKGQTITTTDNTTDTDTPSVSPSTKAKKRGPAPAISLDEFLQNSGGEPPASFSDYSSSLGWTPEFAGTIWQQFCRYWRSPDAKGGGRKRDWLTTWQNWCDREHSRRSQGSGRTANGGLAAAMRASVAERYGASRGDSPEHRGSAAGQTRPDTSGETDSLGLPAIPF